MLETSRICAFLSGCLRGVPVLLTVAVAACASVAPEAPPQPLAAANKPAPAPRPADATALAEEARALLAQAETDIQRARARRALWSGAWESLVASRAAQAAGDSAAAMRHARRASELAQLGLEQVAYAPVGMAAVATAPGK